MYLNVSIWTSFFYIRGASCAVLCVPAREPRPIRALERLELRPPRPREACCPVIFFEGYNAVLLLTSDVSAQDRQSLSPPTPMRLCN